MNEMKEAWSCHQLLNEMLSVPVVSFWFVGDLIFLRVNDVTRLF